jgi:sialate O-acetylesterase
MFKHLSILSSALLFLSLIPAHAQPAETKLELATPFTKNMILQREAPVPVWGFDKPDTKITVSFAGQEKSTTTAKNGKWTLKLDPLKASAEEREMKITSSSGQTLTLGGVLVGEVWFSSGQSNMVWEASKSSVKDLAETIAKSEKEIPIREININTESSVYPQDRAISDAGWKKSTEAPGFSALSLAFAYDIYKELGVPVGILLSAHSNTRIEAFTQGDAIKTHPELKADADLIYDAEIVTPRGQAAFQKYLEEIPKWQAEAGEAALAAAWIPKRPDLPGITSMWRGPSQFYNGKIHPLVPYGIRGTLWCQGESNESDGVLYAARMEALLNGYRAAWNMPEMPFIFTQLQSYGKVANPNEIGLAEIRQSQHQFFMDNRKNVGMVVQFDVNSDDAGGIHYFSKLHPGQRMARWALAKQYGKNIPFTGPIYTGYKVEGERVIVSFEKESLFGGLMTGSKGSSKDIKDPEKYYEPARPTPSVELKQFRLCGADKKWHPAVAKIEGDSVVISSPQVPAPIGVQYAYSAAPAGANLYNQAGLPATPFCAMNGELIHVDAQTRAAQQNAQYARFIDPNLPILQVAEYFRDGAIIQRDKPIPIWGHANVGETVTVTLGSVTKTVQPNKFLQWSIEFPALKASATPITLEVKTTNGFSKKVSDILVGDVWYITGTHQLIITESPYNEKAKDAVVPEAMPLVREFKRRSAGNSTHIPRKRSFETGGGKYLSYWATADYSKPDQGVTTFAYHFAKTLARQGIPQGFITMSSGRDGKTGQPAGQYSSPLAWTSYHGIKNVKTPAFQARINEVSLQYPGSEISKKAVAEHLEKVGEFIKLGQQHAASGADFTSFRAVAPGFPEAGTNKAITVDKIPTYAYNWNVSPLTPMAVSGVIWIPSQAGIGENPADYATELEIYAKSLPTTYGQAEVPFLYVQPSTKLVDGITAPTIPGAKAITIEEWPKSLAEIAQQLAEAVK